MAEKKQDIITYRKVKENEEINLLIEKGNEVLDVLGFTEHSRKHAAKVAETAGKILKDLGYGPKKSGSAKLPGTCMISATASTGTTTPIPEHCWLMEF